MDFDKNVLLKDLSEEERKHTNRGAFVMLYTQWARNCSAVFPLLGELADEYSSKHFTFGKVDIGRSHHVAKQCNVDTSTSSKQLPTFILFENGKEITRLPMVNSDGKVIKSNFTKVSICTHRLYS